MRGMKSFILLLVVAIPLGYYAYRDSKKELPSDTPKKDRVFTVEADKIDEITVKSTSGEQTTLRKSGTDWEITQPAGTKPDNSEVSGLTSNLSSMEIQRVVEENPADLKDFGLAEPRVEVAFKSGGKEQRLQIGQKTPTGSDLYAKIADQKKVFLVSSYLESTFNKSPFDLRDKAVLKLDRDKIDSLDITAAQGETRFEKANTEWKMTKPMESRADFSAVDGLVSKLNSAQMKAMTAAEGGDLKQYGLDKPAATVKLGAGSSQATLAIGSAAAEGTVYARDLSRPAIFTVESSILDDLKKDPSDYRQKDLFDARAFNSNRIEITRNGQTVAFEKTKGKDKDGKDEEKWRKVVPAAADADSANVESLISTAASSRATGFVDSTAKTALDKPELTIAIKYDEGKKEDRVSFARVGSDGFASRAGVPGAAKVDVATIDGIVKSLETAEKPPAPPTPPTPPAAPGKK
jgi:Domain of unknown function (DUF4340)